MRRRVWMPLVAVTLGGAAISYFQGYRLVRVVPECDLARQRRIISESYPH